jgi:hypothetical protein
MAREVGMKAFRVDDFSGIEPILRNERLLQGGQPAGTKRG